MNSGISDVERERRKKSNSLSTKINFLAWIIEVNYPITRFDIRLSFPIIGSLRWTRYKIIIFQLLDHWGGFNVGLSLLASARHCHPFLSSKNQFCEFLFQLAGFLIIVLPTPLRSPIRLILNRKDGSFFAKSKLKKLGRCNSHRLTLAPDGYIPVFTWQLSESIASEMKG